MGYEAETHNMRATITANNRTINMVMDSLCGFSLHVTIGAVKPYHCPSQEEHVAYVVWPTGLGTMPMLASKVDELIC